MILIFGGTTEGRIAAAVCDKAAKSYLYATKGADQHLVANHAIQVTGAMEAEDIERLAIERGVELIVDAAHPYAINLHHNISVAARVAAIPTIRLERMSHPADYHLAIHFDTLAEVVEHIESKGVTDILALTGVNSAAALSAIAESHRVTLRIMDREESQRQIEATGFPAQRVIYYNIGAEDNFDKEITEGYAVGAIITKESGNSGGYSEKIKLAKALNIPIFVIDRPTLPNYTATVYGEHGLRRMVEQILPHYYELRSGFTTGSAATAACVAALRAIICSEASEKVEIILPNGEPLSIPIHSVIYENNSATATVIKDGGDDPDATHNIEIIARVIFNNCSSEISINGGEGVGRVTLPGIGIEVGEAAINPIPRAMIRSNVEQILTQNRISRGVDIEISVPCGTEVAKRTFNPRLGIIGGISILGTSGIVQPFSSEAFIESIRRQIDICKALGGDTLVINSGAMSERYLKAKYPNYLPQSYIHYGNMIGATIELAAAEGISKVILGVMIGKAVKLAAGALDTHSKHTTLDHSFLATIARNAECSKETIAQIATLTTARQLWSIIPATEREFFRVVKRLCYEHCSELLPNGDLEVCIISDTGEIYS